jgi:hypothetical protein
MGDGGCSGFGVFGRRRDGEGGGTTVWRWLK